MHTGQS
jgi:hypothetical protein